jgi:hypothetical protein
MSEFLKQITNFFSIQKERKVSPLNDVLKDLNLSNTQCEALRGLVQLSQIELPHRFENKLAALKWLKKETQKVWLRRKGSERWHQVDDEKQIDKRAGFIDLFKQLICWQAIEPTQDHYDYVILLGALETRVDARLNYAKSRLALIRQSLVLLGGQRKLMPDKEPSTNQGAKTEADMMAILTGRIFPEAKKQLVDTPMQKAENGQERRPNTEDTIRHWFSSFKPEENVSMLVVSGQPHLRYQEATVRHVFEKVGYKPRALEVCGGEAGENHKISTVLDALARWIYVEYSRLEPQYRNTASNEWTCQLL